MKRKKYIFIIIALVVIGLLTTAFFLFKDNKSFPFNNPLKNIVGGDKDEHGCIGSAGYSWCETKRKCLRTWEEACDGSNSNKACGIQNCNGLDIICGPNPVEVCPEIYQVGDKCRQYARCTINKEGVCRLDRNPKFTECKNCVERCLRKPEQDQIKISACENRCQES